METASGRSDPEPQESSPESVPADPARSGPSSSAIMKVTQKFGFFSLFVLLFLWFSIRLPDTFLTSLNLRNVVANQAVLVLIAAAAIVPLIGNNLDLSVGAVLGLSGVVAGTAMSDYGWPLAVTVILALAVGTAVGVINGLLVTKAGVNSIIVTLGVAAVLGGLIDWYTKGQSITIGLSRTLLRFGTGSWLGVPKMVFLWLPLLALVWALLSHTPYGRALHAVGSNRDAARLVGINVNRTVLFSFILSAALASVAGVLDVARTNVASPISGPNFLLPGLSAAFLSASAFKPGVYNIPGSVLAVFFIAVSVNGLALSGVAPWINQVFNGAALVIAATVSVMLGRLRLLK